MPVVLACEGDADRDAATNARGLYRFSDVPEGTCTISFPTDETLSPVRVQVAEGAELRLDVELHTVGRQGPPLPLPDGAILHVRWAGAGQRNMDYIVYDDGRLEYQGGSNARVRGRRSAQLSPDSMARARVLAALMSSSSSYVAPGSFHRPVFFVTYRAEDRIRTLRVFTRDARAPAALRQMRDELADVCGVSRWVDPKGMRRRARERGADGPPEYPLLAQAVPPQPPRIENLAQPAANVEASTVAAPAHGGPRVPALLQAPPRSDGRPTLPDREYSLAPADTRVARLDPEYDLYWSLTGAEGVSAEDRNAVPVLAAVLETTDLRHRLQIRGAWSWWLVYADPDAYALSPVAHVRLAPSPSSSRGSEPDAVGPYASALAPIRVIRRRAGFAYVKIDGLRGWVPLSSLATVQPKAHLGLRGGSIHFTERATELLERPGGKPLVKIPADMARFERLGADDAGFTKIRFYPNGGGWTSWVGYAKTADIASRNSWSIPITPNIPFDKEARCSRQVDLHQGQAVLSRPGGDVVGVMRANHTISFTDPGPWIDIEESFGTVRAVPWFPGETPDDRPEVCELVERIEARREAARAKSR